MPIVCVLKFFFRQCKNMYLSISFQIIRALQPLVEDWLSRLVICDSAFVIVEGVCKFVNFLVVQEFFYFFSVTFTSSV